MTLPTVRFEMTTKSNTVFLLAFAIFLGVSLDTINTHHVKYVPESRLSGGQPASPAQFPSNVAIRNAKAMYTHFCSGTILNPNWILTAAVCVKEIRLDSRDIELVVGSTRISTSSGYRYFVDRAVVHPKFIGSKEFNAHNIALIKTTERIIFNELVQPVSIAFDVFGEDHRAQVAGWRWVRNGCFFFLVLQQIQ